MDCLIEAQQPISWGTPLNISKIHFMLIITFNTFFLLKKKSVIDISEKAEWIIDPWSSIAVCRSGLPPIRYRFHYHLENI